MRGNHIITKSLREENMPKIKEFLEAIQVNKDYQLELAESDMNPSTCEQMLQELGYERYSSGCNTETFEFTIHMKNDEASKGARLVTIYSDAYTYQLIIRARG